MYLIKSTKYKKVFYKKSNILLSTVIHMLTITLCSYRSQRLKIHNKEEEISSTQTGQTTYNYYKVINIRFGVDHLYDILSLV